MPRKNIQTPEEIQQREIVEGIAKNLLSLARAVDSLLNGTLKKRAIVVLLASASQLPQSTVEKVLKALQDLESDWLNR